jgi:hypothetical protein
MALKSESISDLSADSPVSAAPPTISDDASVETPPIIPDDPTVIVEASLEVSESSDLLSLANVSDISSDDIYSWHKRRLLSFSSVRPKRTESDPTSTVPGEQSLQIPASPSAGLVDPFASLPVSIDGLTNELLQFYLGSTSAYWSTAYALSDTLQPSLRATWQSFMPCVEHFHILMARSALHQLQLNDQLREDARKRLRVAGIRHRGQALSVLRKRMTKSLNADDDVLTAMLSLATFEHRYGESEQARTHFLAARTAFKTRRTQSQLGIDAQKLQALWFEGIYTDPFASFIWSHEDVSHGHRQLTELLTRADDIWKVWQHEPTLRRKTGARRKRFVSSKSRLHQILRRDCTGCKISIYADIDESVAQLRCLLIYTCIITALWRYYEMLSPAKAANAMRAYTDWIEAMLKRSQLNSTSALPDVLWIMLQSPLKHRPDGITYDFLKELDFDDCQWRASSIAHTIKYLPDLWQQHLRGWLLNYIGGSVYEGRLVVDEYAFSYAAGWNEPLRSAV